MKTYYYSHQSILTGCRSSSTYQYIYITFTLSPRRAMVITHTHAKNQVSVGSKEGNTWMDRRMDRITFPTNTAG